MNPLLKNYLHKFSKKPFLILYSLFVLISAVFFIMGYRYYNYEKEILLNERFDFLAVLSDYKQSLITAWLDERNNHLEVLKANTPVAEKITNLIYPAYIPDDLINWFDVLKKQYQYEEIILVSLSDNIIKNHSTANFRLNAADSALCRIAITSNSVKFSDSDSEFAGKDKIKFYVPLNNSENISQNTAKVLIFTVNAESLFKRLLNVYVYKIKSLEFEIVKSLEDEIVYLFSSDTTKDTINTNSEIVLSKGKIINGHEGFVEAFDNNNNEVIAYVQSVPQTFWVLISKMDKEEFNKPINELAKIVIGTLIFADLLFALILFLLWKKSIAVNFKKAQGAEIERVKSEVRFETLVKGVKEYAIFILDANGFILSWNSGAEKIKGYKEEEIIGRHFSIFYSPEDIELDKPSKALASAEEKGSFTGEGWRLKSDGSKFWSNVVISALKDNDGKVYGFLKLTRDMTEKRNLEKSIISSRDFHLKLFSDFPNPVWRSGKDGKCDYFNNAWLDLTGRKLEDEIGDGWLQNVHPDDRIQTYNVFKEAVINKNRFVIEYRIKNYENEYKWLIDYGIPFYNLDGELSGFLGSCFEIDDRKKYEETINLLLRISEKLYSSLEIDQILDALVNESINLVKAESGFAAVLENDEFITRRYYNKDHWEYLKLNWKKNSEFCSTLKSNTEGYLTENNFIDLNPSSEVFNKYSVKHSVAIPLFGSDGEMNGFFQIHNKKNGANFNESELNLLKSLAHNASISLTKSLSIERLRKTELQLRDSESELRQLAAQLQNAREIERHHIAREIHDELGQIFTGINLNILVLRDALEQNINYDKESILNEILDVKKLVDKGIQSVRDIAEGLRSYVLEHLGLIPAVEEYCKEFQRVSNIKCIITSNANDLIISEEKKISLYRIIQEALTNVMCHSRASEIKLSFITSNEYFDLTIEDNGIGFKINQQSKNKTFGILGMKERTMSLNGNLSITNKNGNETGTIIKVSIPLKKLINNGNDL